MGKHPNAARFDFNPPCSYPYYSMTRLRLAFSHFVSVCISNCPRLSVSLFARGGGGGGGAFSVSSFFVAALSHGLVVLVFAFMLAFGLLSNILLLINVPLSNNLIIVLLTSVPSAFVSYTFGSSFAPDVSTCLPTPFCSASLFLSTLETKKPVPNSLPPRTVNPKVGVVPGTTKIRRICGLIKRTVRIRDETENAHHDDADVVNVNISLDELVVDSLKLLLQSANNAVAISTNIKL
uniref:Uncharacterized protein n=1 Tax=Glossina palpalis gambiensis TaxID=67801 RepID=A0A1B0B6E1_9MUSC